LCEDSRKNGEGVEGKKGTLERASAEKAHTSPRKKGGKGRVRRLRGKTSEAPAAGKNRYPEKRRVQSCQEEKKGHGFVLQDGGKGER